MLGGRKIKNLHFEKMGVQMFDFIVSFNFLALPLNNVEQFLNRRILEIKIIIF